MESYIGIDYGGTKLLIGEADSEGNLLSYMRFETGKRNQREMEAHLLKCLKQYKEEVGWKGNIRAAGIGIVGVSDFAGGIWCSCNHEKGEDIPLAAEVSEILGIPAAIDNDVRSAATAELLWGCGNYSRDFIYINVGTGLAAGLVINGEILRGANHNAGEIGHMTVKSSSDGICACQRQGCAELTASGAGITACLRSYAERYHTVLCIPVEKEMADVKEVFRLCREGDELCKKVVEEAEGVLAEVIENLVRTSDPDTVVLGGGIMQDSWFFERVTGRLHASVMRGVKNGVRISSLNPAYAGILGAAAIGKLYLERKGKDEDNSYGK